MILSYVYDIFRKNKKKTREPIDVTEETGDDAEELIPIETDVRDFPDMNEVEVFTES